VTPVEFEEHISVIADRYNVVTMDDVSSHIGESEYTLPKNAAVVTFDDGYRDTLTQALPVLERYSVPATIYVTTDLVGDQYGPFEFRLAEALRNRAGKSISSLELGIDLSGSISNNPEKIYRFLRGNPGKRTTILDKIENESPSGTTMLTDEELRVISEHRLITIGAHGHHHVPLTTLSKCAIDESISECISVLEEIIGYSPNHSSYPYGSYNRDVINAVRNLDFMTAVTTCPNIYSTDKLKTKYLLIPRIDAGIYSPSSIPSFPRSFV